MSSDARDVVIGFCDAFERRSLGDVFAYMAPDVVYENVPLPAMRGIEEAKKFLTPILTNSVQIEFRILNLAISGDTVLTERLDRLHFPGGVVDIPLMGIFVIRDGKVAEWRDYADNGEAIKGFIKAGFDLSSLGIS